MPFEHIFGWLINYKYFVLFPITIVEGPIITIISGFLSSLGIMNIYLVYIVVVVGDLAGDILYYAMGRWGRDSFIERWGRYFGVTPKRVEQLEQHFEKHSGKTILFGKLSHAIGAPILAAAGISKMPIGKFFWFSLLGTLPKSLILLFIGFYFGHAYIRLSKFLDYTALAMVGLAILFVIIYFVMKKVGKKLQGEGVNSN